MLPVKMNPSRLGIVTIPALGTSATQRGVPALFVATPIPMRMLIRNIGPCSILLAHSANELQVTPAMAGCFELPVGTSEAFVLAPKQGIYAIALGAGGLVSYAASDAIPFQMES